MIRVVCHTNLDLHNEVWPTYLPAIPHVGDLIESKSIRTNEFRLILQVVAIAWRHIKDSDSWHPYVELHMTDWQRKLPCSLTTLERNCDGSIRAFYEWYAPNVGISVSAFI